MKRYKYSIAVVLLLITVTVLTVSCSDDEETTDFTLSRRFKPAAIESENGETQVTITWEPSLFATAGSVDYQIDVSKDATFANPAEIEFSTTTKTTAVVITDDRLGIKQDYFARIKAIGAEGTEDSRWAVSESFRILGEQFLNPITSENVIDKSVRFNWRANSDLTKIVLTVAGGTPIEVQLTDADKTALMKQVDGLTAATTYSAEIFAGNKSKGTQTFTTKAGVSGSNVIDLRGTTGDPTILVSTLDTAPSGSVIVLKRGESYNITSAYLLSKSVTILSGLDFGSNLATLRMSSNFNFVANSAVDSVVFKDLVIKGGRANNGSYLSDYVINANNATTVGKVKLDNCTIKILRGIMRGQASGAGAKFGEFSINNCVIDSIRDFAIAEARNTSAMDKIKITNTTVYKSRKLIWHVTNNTSVTIENSTFNEVPAGASPAANYLIDFNTANSGSIVIKNCIFGKPWDEAGNGTTTLSGVFRAGANTTPNVTNSFATSDFVNTPSPLSGLSTYSGSSTSLFTDPANGNFKIKDANFVGKSSAGDPRWR